MKSKNEELLNNQNSRNSLPGAARTTSSSIVQTLLQQVYPQAETLPATLAPLAERYARRADPATKQKLKACIRHCPLAFQQLQEDFLLMLEGLQQLLRTGPCENLSEVQGYLHLHKKAHREYLLDEELPEAEDRLAGPPATEPTIQSN